VPRVKTEMSFATEALRSFRSRGHGSLGESRLPAVFVMEPTMSITAAVTASWCPISSLQTLGATERGGVGAGRATIEHAIELLAARTVVFCGEGTVRPDQAADRERLLGACVAVNDDAVLGHALRSRAVAVEALWFDTVEGDIYRWNAKTRRFDLLADGGMERFFADIHRRAVSTPRNPTTET